jgi:hypothetical protein
MSHRSAQTVARAALFIVGATCSAQLLATPSGLNNIPTADTPGQGEYVFQAFSNFGEGRPTDTNLGFKTGFNLLGQKLEVGLDGRVAPNEGGPVVAQVKYAATLQPGTQVAVGVANVALRGQDRDRAGNPFKYALVTRKFEEAFRIHGGYGFQTDNDSFILGVDYSTRWMGRDLVLRSDFTEIQDGDQVLGSLGFLYVLNKAWVLEAWASKPLEDGRAVGTLKFNLVF